MIKILLKTTAFTLLCGSLLNASGWRIPESSPRSFALSGAYIANSNGADSTYYNPANMSFNENITQLEFGVTNINLPKLEYVDNRSNAANGYFYDGDTLEENSQLPSLFISTKDYDSSSVRYGFSITVPGGLTRRWDEAYPMTFAEEFGLRIVEFNPTVAYKISNNFSIGGGLRAIYSDGVTKSSGTIPVDLNADGTPDTTATITRDLEGDTIEYGYNFAIAYLPTKNSNLSLTYRSNVDLKEKGTATLISSSAYPALNTTFSSDASVIVPLPAVLSVAFAFDIGDTTIELEADRTYWSSYETLDFEYDKDILNPVLISAFDNAKPRNWKDTDAYRLGLTHRCNDTLTVMLGYSIDGNAIPESSVSFESPDYNSNTYSAGFDYQLTKDSSFGFGYLYSKKDDRTVTNYLSDGTTKYIDGTLSNAKAHIISLAYRVDF